MSTSRQKDDVCSCDHRIFLDSADGNAFLEVLDKQFRYEVFVKNQFYSFLEYIDSEDRWFFARKIVELSRDKNNNLSIHTFEDATRKGKG